jgi:integrase
VATVYQRKKSKPIPKGAEIRTVGGKAFAYWTDARGKPKRASLSADGKAIIVKSSIYTIRLKDQNGCVRFVSSRTRDKDAAKQMAAQLEMRATQVRQGLICPADERLAKAARRPLREHLAEYIQFLTHKGDTVKHVRLTEQRIREIITKGAIRSTTDLRESAVRSAIDQIRTAPEQFGRPALGLGTLNGYVRAVSGFANWLHKDRRTPDRPISGLGLFNAETDRRLERRSMAVAELQWLFQVTESRLAYPHHASGVDRAMCYLIAATTGYRAGELKSLTTDNFDVGSATPAIVVNAAYSKRRRLERQPLPSDFIPKLKEWLSKKEAGSRVFASIPRDTARMMRSDLQAARSTWLGSATSDGERAEWDASDFLKYQDAQGRKADFHSLRVAYVTHLSIGGVDVKTLQTLARHSTPILTMNTYNQRGQAQLAGPVDQLGKTLMGSPSRTATGVGGDYRSDYSQQAGGGSNWQSAASSPVDRQQANIKPTNEKTPAKPGVSGTARGSSVERLRSESNRRWRICNPLP